MNGDKIRQPAPTCATVRYSFPKPTIVKNYQKLMKSKNKKRIFFSAAHGADLGSTQLGRCDRIGKVMPDPLYLLFFQCTESELFVKNLGHAQKVNA
jgi:hypothetical protein